MSGSGSGRRFVLPALVVIAICVVAGGAIGYFQDGHKGVPGDASDADQVAFGARVYGRICANCHGTELSGQLGWEKPLRDGTRLAPSHSADGYTWKYTDDSLFKVVKFGGETLKPDGGVSRMPGFGEKLTNDEIWAVIAYIKSTWPTNLQDTQQKASVASTKKPTDPD